MIETEQEHMETLERTDDEFAEYAKEEAQAEQIEHEIDGVENQMELDMRNIAKLVHETSKKYGGIYISAAHCKDSGRSWCTFAHGERLVDANWYGK
jgi:hypothetical protein